MLNFLRTLAEKQIISTILWSIQIKSSPPFLSFEYVLSMLLNMGHFLASHSYKKCSYKKSVYYSRETFYTFFFNTLIG